MSNSIRSPHSERFLRPSMADKTDFESRPSQISKDVRASESPIPLSPQWLLSKSGEMKSGLTGENHFSSNADHSSRPDLMKSPGFGEEARENNKKKVVFRPSVLDMDSGRRDRWRDEERDTNSAVRRDRWREGDKELTDNRKADRWTDSSGKHYGDARRGPTERWTDSGNRESSNDQRRESKWNTRWGPDDKETDNVREKWVESSKDPDLVEKSSSHVSYHGRDEKEGDHYRPWRLNHSQSRGRADPPTPNRNPSVFAHGWGRGETNVSTFSLGRGRVNSTSNASTQLQSVGYLSEKGEITNGESLPWRYGRTKLLDVYRTTDTRSSEKFLTELLQIPSLTQEDAIEPLALCSPTTEELMILKGIEKGDVVSSGAPQITRDGSMGRNPADLLQSRRNKLGTGDDMSLDANDSKEKTSENAGGVSNYPEHMPQDQQVHTHGFHTKVESTQDYQKFADCRQSSEAAREDGAYRKNDDGPINGEANVQGHSSTAYGGPWRSSSFGEHLHAVSQDRELPGAVGARAVDVGWSDTQKDLNTEWGNRMADQSFARLEASKWQMGDNSGLRKQSSAFVEKEQEVQKGLPPSPEDLVLYYKDPQGEIQGPFGGGDIIVWFEAGYFGIDLLVRLAGAPPESPFCSLGDVMPHLRAKARPPPGFGASKPNEITDASGRFNFSNFGTVPASSGEIDMIQNDPRYKHNSAKEAENRFLESLMTGNMSGVPLEKSVPSEGTRGYLGNNTNATPSLGVESADSVSLLAKKMTLERQRSLPNPYPWPGRDTADLVQDSSLPHSRLLSSFVDNARPQLVSQNVDLMSILQGLPERSSTGLNNGPSGWSNFSTQVGLDPLQDKLDMHQAQNYPPQAAYGIQQQSVQPQTNLLGHVMDSTSSIFGPEELLSPSLSQDPHLLNLLQHHLLQSQTRASIPLRDLLNRPNEFVSRILSDYNRLLSLEKRGERQQLLRQQKELLSQVLSEHNSHQRLGKSSYGMLHTTEFSTDIAPNDHSRFQPSHELFKMGSPVQVPNLQDERVSNFVVNPSVSHDVNQNVGAEISKIPLPHQVFSEAVQQSSWDHTLSEPISKPEHKISLMSTSITDLLPQLGMTQNYQSEMNNPDLVSTSVAAVSFPSDEHLEESIAMAPVTIGSDEKDSLITEQAEVFGMPSDGALKVQAEGNQSINESFVEKEVRNVASRESKKSSDKKSKKQKSSKAHSSDLTKGVTKTQESRLAEVEGTNVSTEKSDRQTLPEDLSVVSALQEREWTSDKLTAGIIHAQDEQKTLSSSIAKTDGLTPDGKDQPGQGGSNSQLNNIQVQPGQRGWKPAPGFKPKSLLEIQQEEQSRAHTEIAVPEVAASLISSSVSTPWVGVVANSDLKTLREAKLDALSSGSNLGKPDSSVNQKSRKSQLHDLFQDTVVANSSEKEMENDSFPYASVMSSQSESVEDNNFIEAKDTKKGRKKSAKGKGAGSKVSMTTTVSDVPVGLSPIDKSKSSRAVQQDKEVLPAIPSGPSLGDFVVWKGETTSSTPPPAWSTDSGKVPKPSSLRDIQKEQERKVTSQHIPVPSAQKSAPSQPSRGGGSSWSASAASPAKAASPLQISSQVSLSKHKVDDDLFWGPSDQPKQETKNSDFPQLGSSWGSKSTPMKATSGVVLSRQKSFSGRPVEHPSPTNVPANLSLKGKKDFSTKYSVTEATDFREWCENECARLINTKDTNFLEYCLKQSRQEAEELLVHNLGSVDPDHEFIDKFLNFKDLLPAEVLEIAFQSQSDRRVTGSGAGEVISDNGGFGDLEQHNATAPEGSAKGGGGKKKAKKGKKVSPSSLGFNVVSNRIMMGEIQGVED